MYFKFTNKILFQLIFSSDVCTRGSFTLLFSQPVGLPTSFSSVGFLYYIHMWEHFLRDIFVRFTLITSFIALF